MLQCVNVWQSKLLEVPVMSTQAYDQWMEMNRAALQPIIRWSEIASHSAEKYARFSLGIAGDCIDVGTRQMQLLGAARDPQTWAAENAKLAAELGQKLMGRASEGLAVAKEARDAFASLAATPAEKV
jgi:hypothetical protein